MIGSNLVGSVLAKLAELKRTTFGPTRSPRANGRSRRANQQAAEMLEERIVMTVRGFLGAVNAGSGVVQGWVVDTEQPGRQFKVIITVDNHSEIVFTGLPRPDVSRATGVAGDHGFQWQVPAEFRDGRPHQISAQVETGFYSFLPLPSSSETFQTQARGGVVITPLTPTNSQGLLETTEAGGTASFSVVLTARPTANVTIPVSSLDLTEGRTNKTSLTFTPSNWNQPQTVTVTGVDDRIHDATVVEGTEYQINLGPARSTDSRYNGVDPRNVSLTNLDNEEYIRFVASYANEGSREGFNDPVLGQQRREAFETALLLWSDYFVAAYPGETITVDAQFEPLDGNRLAEARSVNSFNNVSGGVAGTSYGSALANHLARRDLNTRNPEIQATFNSNANWHYGSDGQLGAGQYDFVTLAMHEIGHGLNFFSRLNPNGSFDGSTRGIWDRFLENSRGTNLIDMTAAQRAAALTSGSLFWEGTAGRTGNGGQRPQIYAPRDYVSGSSTSHLSETQHGLELMSPTFFFPGSESQSQSHGIGNTRRHGLDDRIGIGRIQQSRSVCHRKIRPWHSRCCLRGDSDGNTQPPNRERFSNRGNGHCHGNSTVVAVRIERQQVGGRTRQYDRPIATPERSNRQPADFVTACPGLCVRYAEPFRT